MLKKFTLSNFKSFKHATLELSPLTLLIGANASGKSNALEALQLLSWLAKGHALNDYFNAFDDSELHCRGTFSDLPRSGNDNFTLELALGDSNKLHTLKLNIAVDSDIVYMRNETILNKDNSSIYTFEDSNSKATAKIVVNGTEANLTVSRNIGCFQWLNSFLPNIAFNNHSQKVNAEIATGQFIDALKNSFFFEFDPIKMSDYTPVKSKHLNRVASNLSSTLYDLCETQQLTGDVLKFVGDLPERKITDIKFHKTDRNDVMLKLEEKFGGKSEFRDAPLLSFGTLRVLAVAAALLSAKEGSTIFFEEIDNGLHPSRTDSLIKNIHKVAKKRKLTVLLTSHNPALLDALPFDVVRDVVFCYRDPKEGDSRLLKLSNLDEFPGLMAQGKLGGLLTDGKVDYYAKHQQTPAQRKRAFQIWIKQLEKDTAIP